MCDNVIYNLVPPYMAGLSQADVDDDYKMGLYTLLSFPVEDLRGFSHSTLITDK